MNTELSEHRKILTEAWYRGVMAIGVPLAIALIAMLIVNWQLIKLVASLSLKECVNLI